MSIAYPRAIEPEWVATLANADKPHRVALAVSVVGDTGVLALETYQPRDAAIGFYLARVYVLRPEGALQWILEPTGSTSDESGPPSYDIIPMRTRFAVLRGGNKWSARGTDYTCRQSAGRARSQVYVLGEGECILSQGSLTDPSGIAADDRHLFWSSSHAFCPPCSILLQGLDVQSGLLGERLFDHPDEQEPPYAASPGRILLWTDGQRILSMHDGADRYGEMTADFETTWTATPRFRLAPVAATSSGKLIGLRKCDGEGEETRCVHELDRERRHRRLLRVEGPLHATWHLFGAGLVAQSEVPNGGLQLRFAPLDGSAGGRLLIQGTEAKLMDLAWQEVHGARVALVASGTLFINGRTHVVGAEQRVVVIAVRP